MHVSLAKDYISQASLQLGMLCDHVLDSETVSRSGKGNFLALPLRGMDMVSPFSVLSLASWDADVMGKHFGARDGLLCGVWLSCSDDLGLFFFF